MPDLATGGGFDSILGQLSDAKKATDQLNPEANQAEKTIKDQGAKIVDISSRLKQQTPAPEPPAAPDLPKQPKTEFSDPLKAFGNAAIVLSIFGSALTRAPLTTALKAASAGMKAYHEGDKEALQKSQDDWRDAVDATLKQHRIEMEQYRAILEKRNASVNETLAELQGVAAATSNANMLAAIGSGRLSAATQLVQTYQSQGAKLNELKMERDRLDETKRHNQAMEAGGARLDDDTLRTMAEQYITGDKSVFQNLGRGKQGAENVVALRQKVMEIAKERNLSGAQMATMQAEFQGLISGERVLGGRTAQAGMAVNEAKMLAPLALDASDKVDRSKYKSLNDVLLAAERGTGDESVVRLGIATNSLINIYARAISPTGTPTVSDKEHARELLAASWSKGQYKAGVDQLMLEMNAAMKSPGMVRDEFRQGYGASTSEPGGAQGAVPAEAVTMLKGDPSQEMQQHFDEVFGAGAAQRALKAQ